MGLLRRWRRLRRRLCHLLMPALQLLRGWRARDVDPPALARPPRCLPPPSCAPALAPLRTAAPLPVSARPAALGACGGWPAWRHPGPAAAPAPRACQTRSAWLVQTCPAKGQAPTCAPRRAGGAWRRRLGGAQAERVHLVRGVQQELGAGVQSDASAGLQLEEAGPALAHTRLASVRRRVGRVHPLCGLVVPGDHPAAPCHDDGEQQQRCAWRAARTPASQWPLAGGAPTTHALAPLPRAPGLCCQRCTCFSHPPNYKHERVGVGATVL